LHIQFSLHRIFTEIYRSLYRSRLILFRQAICLLVKEKLSAEALEKVAKEKGTKVSDCCRLVSCLDCFVVQCTVPLFKNIYSKIVFKYFEFQQRLNICRRNVDVECYVQSSIEYRV